MAKHDLALAVIRAEINRTTHNQKAVADRRIWLQGCIEADTQRGRIPDDENQAELLDLDAKVKANYIKIQELLGSYGVLEDDKDGE